MSVLLYFIQAQLQHFNNSHYFLVNLALFLLVIPPTLFLRQAMKRFKLNSFLFFPLGFLFLIGLTLPLNFFSYYILPISINIYWVYVFICEVALIALTIYLWRKNRFLSKESLPSKSLPTKAFFFSKQNLLDPNFWAKTFLVFFLLLNAIVFPFTYTNAGGDTAFHAAKINVISATHTISNRSPRQSGQTDFVYLNNGLHQLFASISELTGVEPHFVWRDSSYFCRFMVIFAIIGLFYYVFKNFALGVFGGSLFYIWSSSLNVYSYPFELVFMVGWPLLLILLNSLLQHKLTKFKSLLLPCLIIWGLSIVHIGMFALSAFLFLGFLGLWFYSARSQFRQTQFWQTTLRLIVFLVIACLPFIISSLQILLTPNPIHDNAVEQIAPYIADKYSAYEQTSIHKYLALYKNLEPLSLNFTLITVIIFLAYFLFTKRQIIKMTLLSYGVYLLGVFTVFGFVISRFLPYWALIRFDGISKYLFAFLFLEAIIWIVTFSRQKHLQHDPKYQFWLTEAQTISVILLLFLALASGKFFDFAKLQMSPGYNLIFESNAQRYQNIATHIEPNTVFVSDWEIDHWLPTFAPTSSFSIGENSGFLPHEQELSTALTFYNPNSKQQDQIADENHIDYVILNTPDRDFCEQYNPFWSAITYDDIKQLCLLKNQY